MIQTQAISYEQNSISNNQNNKENINQLYDEKSDPQSYNLQVHHSLQKSVQYKNNIIEQLAQIKNKKEYLNNIQLNQRQNYQNSSTHQLEQSQYEKDYLLNSKQFYQVPNYMSNNNQQHDKIIFDDISYIIRPTEEIGGLYLGNLAAASNVQFLKDYNILSILTVAADANIKYNKNEILYHKIINVQDEDKQDLFKFFDDCEKFISFSRQYSSVLVHCFAGVSRSATIIIAYLMKKYKLAFLESFNYVRSKREQIYPNKGFIKQLMKYEENLKNVTQSQQSIQKEHMIKEQEEQQQVIIDGESQVIEPFVPSQLQQLPSVQAQHKYFNELEQEQSKQKSDYHQREDRAISKNGENNQFIKKRLSMEYNNNNKCE